MSYTPINWQTGDTITAEKMNKMDNGWSVETSTQTLFNDSVTTESGEYGNEAEVSMTKITADTITVTCGGTEYVVTKVVMSDGNDNGYGGVDSAWNYDFTEYPFAIVSQSGDTVFATETAGTFSFKIDTTVTAIETSDKFDIVRGYGTTTTTTEIFSGTYTTVVSGNLFSASLPNTPQYNYDVLQVTFNGTDYTCARASAPGDGSVYGAPTPLDFSTYPFCIFLAESGNYLYTAEAGTYTLTALAQGETTSTTEKFREAVVNCTPTPSGLPLRLVSYATTFDEVVAANDAGRPIYYPSGKRYYFITSVPASQSGTMTYLPTGAGLTLTFDENGIFYAML